ncbi:MAG: hypothetical protein LBK43_02950 [Treponema sp.]|nr:hypothetical protein [Treponema sp.]
MVVFTLAACTDLTRPGELSGEPIAQGMGQALIRLDPLNARTAIPSLESLHFTLDFTASETPERKVSKTLEEGLTLTVALESGDWDLVVEGFSKEDRLMVRGTSLVSITAGISLPVAVYLTPVFSLSSDRGTGTLDYCVEFPGTVSRASLVLYPLDASGTGQKTPISANIEGTITGLPAGSYQAFIDLYDGTDNTAAVWTGVVHIYDGSATSLAQEFTPTNFAVPQIAGASENTLAGKLNAALAYSTGSYTIVLDGKETDLTSFTPQTLSVASGKAIAITIKGNGKTVQLGNKGSLFTLEAASGSSLTLVVQDITLQGRNDNTASLVRVNSGGILEMKAGSNITGNTCPIDGGGVYVNGGTFTMSGGTISYNTASYDGGGVFLWSGAFTLAGGTISHNSAAKGGGVCFSGAGITFSMSNGTIRGNSATQGGGGMYVYSGTFTMTGGVIYGKEAGDDKNTAGSGGAAIYIKSGTVVNLPILVTTDTTIDMR